MLNKSISKIIPGFQSGIKIAFLSKDEISKVKQNSNYNFIAILIFIISILILTLTDDFQPGSLQIPYIIRFLLNIIVLFLLYPSIYITLRLFNITITLGEIFRPLALASIIEIISLLKFMNELIFIVDILIVILSTVITVFVIKHTSKLNYFKSSIAFLISIIVFAIFAFLFYFVFGALAILSGMPKEFFF